jgi:hypothetical protein
MNNVGQSTATHIDLQQNGTSTCCHIPSTSGAESPRLDEMWGSHKAIRALSGCIADLSCSACSYAAPLVATALQTLTW